MRISQKYFAKRLHRNFSSCEFNEISVLEMLQTTSFCAIGSLLLAQSLFTPCAIVNEFLRNRLGLSAQSLLHPTFRTPHLSTPSGVNR
jgi:hypothetical protein